MAALADAGAALEREDYVEAARACAAFLLDELRDADGNLLRTWKDGRATLPAYLEDHAYLVQALLVLYEATFEERWYVEAVALADTMIERFGDPERGGFFTTAADVPHLVSRRKDLEDAPTPSGNSAAALGLLRLARISGDAEYERQAAGVLALHAPVAMRHPTAFGHLLQALDLHLATPSEVAIVGAGRGGIPIRRPPHPLPPPHRARRDRPRQHRRHRGPAARGPHHGRRPAGRLRLRALRLPVARHLGRGAARGAGAVSYRISLRAGRNR